MKKFNPGKNLKGCRENNRKAQEELYKHYFALMYHICKDFESERENILSLINEGFLKIFLNIASFSEEKGSFEAWAKRIMTNHCIDYKRRKENLSQTTALDDAPHVQNLCTAAPAFVEEEILFHMKKLPPTTKEIFSLHIFNGFSHKEIAEKMDIAESTSRWHVLEARKFLKKVAHKIL